MHEIKKANIYKNFYNFYLLNIYIKIENIKESSNKMYFFHNIDFYKRVNKFNFVNFKLTI